MSQMTLNLYVQIKLSFDISLVSNNYLKGVMELESGRMGVAGVVPMDVR